MGITFLAAGTSVPEAVSSVIVAKQGDIFHTKISFSNFVVFIKFQVMDQWELVILLDQTLLIFFYVWVYLGS